jgi:hypothetical protein
MDRRGRDRMVIGFPPHVKSVPITTNCVSSNPTRSEVYSIQHYVIKCVNDATGRWFSDCHIDITEILLKVALNTINYKTTTSYKKKSNIHIFVHICLVLELLLYYWILFTSLGILLFVEVGWPICVMPLSGKLLQEMQKKVDNNLL